MTTPRPYTKPALTAVQQVELLKSRGLIVSNLAEAERFFTSHSYYRFSAYTFVFEAKSHAGKRLHTFIPGTTFERVRDVYLFDQALRFLTMQAMECLEISLRTRLCLELTNYNGDGHFYLNPRFFSSSSIHKTFLDKCAEIAIQSQETFMVHYRNNYDSPMLPPLWMMVEVLSFGQVSMFFDNLRMSQQKVISQKFSLPPQTMASWFASLAYTRNLCAHYSRLWNRHFTKRPKHDGSLPDTRDASFAQQANVMHFFLQSVELTFVFGSKLSDLLAKYPTISEANLGF